MLEQNVKKINAILLYLKSILQQLLSRKIFDCLIYAIVKKRISKMEVFLFKIISNLEILNRMHIIARLFLDFLRLIVEWRVLRRKRVLPEKSELDDVI